MPQRNNIFSFFLLKHLTKSLFSISVIFLFISCFPSGKTTRKVYAKNISVQPFDAIIVPGCPYNGSNWSEALKLRITWAVYLFNNGYTKNIIFSGSDVYSPYVESKVMALYAIALAVPEKNVFAEQKAEHSTENVYYSYVLAKQRGFKKLALASDPFQTHNLRSFIRKFHIEMLSLPAQYDILTKINTEEPKINAPEAKENNFVSIVERQGSFKRIKGTFGKYIVWHEEDLKKKRFRRRFKKRMIPAGQ